MKVYDGPDHITLNYNYGAKFDLAAESAKERKYAEDMKAWLVEKGYNGKQTGGVVSFGVADGHASYMYGDAGAKSVLIHLKIGDAWNFREVSFLPRKEILRRLETFESFLETF
jgi:hypothetical protein